MSHTHCLDSSRTVKPEPSALPAVSLIEPDQLADSLTQPDTLIIDLCSPTAHGRPGIPSAVSLPGPLLQAGCPPAPGRLPPLARLEKLLGQLGYCKDSTIIVSDDEGGGWAGRLLWTLDLIGHRKLAYLNGGLRAWHHAGLALQPARTPEPTQVQLKIKNGQVRMTAEQIMTALEQRNREEPGPGLAIWDARSPEEFSGTRQFTLRGGHIPGAVNLEWTRIMDPERGYRLRQDLAELLEAAGLGPGQPLVTHCQAHHRSGLTYMAARLLGYRHISAYDGAWSEWGNRRDTPIATGHH